MLRQINEAIAAHGDIGDALEELRTMAVPDPDPDPGPPPDPDPGPPPPPPTGELNISHSVHSGNRMVDFLLQNPQYVHDGDIVTLVSGNFFSNINIGDMNSKGRRLKERYGNRLEVHCATAGVRNIEVGARELDPLFAALSFIYEPKDTDFPDGSSGSPQHFQNKNANGFNSWSKNLNDRCMRACHDNNRDFTWRVTGRLATTDARPMINGVTYGAFAEMSDGCTVQTQRFGRDLNGQYKRVVDMIIAQYRAEDVLGRRRLALRITVGTGGNAVSPSRAIECARYGWSKTGVDMPAVWPNISNMNLVEDFYNRRERE